MSVEQEWLNAAIAEARTGLAAGGIPIGSVIVRDGQVFGRGHNQRVQKASPTLHAEIDCLENAGRQATYRDTVLVSTLSPCFLCSGAIVQFGVPRVIVGETENFPGAPDFLRSHGVEVVMMDDHTCIALMGQFISDHPDLWNEDIGR